MNSSFPDSSWVPTASPTFLPAPNITLNVTANVTTFNVTSAPSATPTFAPTATPSFAPSLSFAPSATPTAEPDICCCATLGIDKECYDGNKVQIANCTSMINADKADCVSMANASTVCYISECPNADLAKQQAEQGKALVKQDHCFAIGAMFILVAIAIFVCQIRRVQRTKELRPSETKTMPSEGKKRMKKRVRNFYRRFNVSNESFAMRFCFILGIQILVLGGIAGNINETLQVLAALQALEFITVVWKTHKMIVPNRYEEIKDCNRAKGIKESIKANDSIIDVGFKIYKCMEHFLAPEDEDRSDDGCYVNPSDIYDDITTPITRASLMFLCQIILLILYLTAIYFESPPDITQKEPYIYFITGVFVQIAYQEGKDKQPIAHYNSKKKYWKHIMDARKERTDEKGKKRTIVECVDEDDQHKYVPECSLVARIIMSNLVNIQGTSMLMYLLPLHLSTSEDPINFVLNSCAAYIIVELDDSFDNETIKLIHSYTDLTACNTPSSEAPQIEIVFENENPV